MPRSRHWIHSSQRNYVLNLLQSTGHLGAKPIDTLKVKKTFKSDIGGLKKILGGTKCLFGS